MPLSSYITYCWHSFLLMQDLQSSRVHGSGGDEWLGVLNSSCQRALAMRSFFEKEKASSGRKGDGTKSSSVFMAIHSLLDPKRRSYAQVVVLAVCHHYYSQVL